jgi:(p)ppGpp synthase/HD superfamily hydrolase
MRSEPPPRLTDRFLTALALAIEIHGDRRRLGTRIPYVAHLLVVTGLVLEDGGDEDQAITALLHDAVEDGGARSSATTGRRGAALGPVREQDRRGPGLVPRDVAQLQSASPAPPGP